MVGKTTQNTTKIKVKLGFVIKMNKNEYNKININLSKIYNFTEIYESYNEKIII